MTSQNNYMISRIFLVICSNHFILVLSISNSSLKNCEKNILDCTRVHQFQSNNEQFTEGQNFQCNDGTRIPKEYICDKVQHCSDGSDEWTKTCKKIARKTRKKRATNGHCEVLPPSPDKTITYECDDNTNSASCMVNGKIREGIWATIACNPNYLPMDESHHESVCRKKNWVPKINSCHKKCKKLNPINVDLECYRNDKQIACNESTLIAGVQVRPTCKQLHIPAGRPPDYEKIICQEDGEWDNVLFSCKAECGIPYTGGELLIANGREDQIDQSPWHVAIYDHNKVLICGGTIIHIRLILSAAHCFHDRRTQEKLEAKNFEIVVSKFNRNYSIPDNKYQKAFKIKEILVSDKGYYDRVDHHTSDIVILILQEKLTISSTVLPACIDPIHITRYPPEGTLGKVSGWGEDENGDLSEQLHTADLPFIGRKRCIEMVPDDFKPSITYDKFCAGSEHAGVLRGDSGGGLLFQQGNFYYLRGIVSIKQATNESKIAAFTDLVPYVNWIVSVRDKIEREMMEGDLPPGRQATTPEATSTRCDNRRFFQCDYGACIDKRLRCDGRKNCVDGSDEFPQLCNPRYNVITSSTTTTKVAPVTPSSRSPATRPTQSSSTSTRTTITTTSSPNPSDNNEGSCSEIPPSEDKTILYQCKKKLGKACYDSDKLIKEGTVATFSCNPNYLSAQNETLKSVCSEGIWLPAVPKCHKICEKLNPINVDLTCYREGSIVECKDDLIVGTKIRPRCKILHSFSGFVPSYLEIVCQKDGKWNNVLFSCQPECGREFHHAEPLIDGGELKKLGYSPWHIAVYDITKSLLICSGTMISPYLVLSAAHCFHDRLNNQKLPAKNYEIVVGKYTRNYALKDTSVQKAFKIKEIRFSNRGYFVTQTYLNNDIAILILEDRIDISPSVLPACVDWIRTEKYNPPEGTPGKVVGWGVNELGKLSENLTTAYLPFISNGRCIRIVPDEFKSFITYDKFCTGSDGPGVLQGDSGGGLLFQEGSSYYIRGIQSLKQPSSTGIAIFTDIADHITWIMSVRNEVEQDVLKKDSTSVSKAPDPDVISGTDKPPTSGLNCTVSLTLKNRQQVCVDKEIFSEPFDKLDTSVWSYTVKIPNDPDFEFVTYDISDEVVYVKQSQLFIKPKVQPDSYIRGSVTLKDCTGKPNTAECTKKAQGYSILPPVLSGQITTRKSFSFRYGKISIRAKLPVGDWIVPEIWLTPVENNYGDYYQSGQVRIAMSRGNKQFDCGNNHYGQRRLEVGVYLGPQYDVKKKLFYKMTTDSWANEFHNYTVTWTPNKMSFQIDGEEIGLIQPESDQTIRQIAGLPDNDDYIYKEGTNKLAPFDREFYITLGVSVGSFDFPDNCTSTPEKPWSNTSPRAMLRFWEKREEWKSTWVAEKSALVVEHVKVWSL